MTVDDTARSPGAPLDYVAEDELTALFRPAPSQTLSLAPASNSWTGESANSRAYRGPGDSIEQCHDRRP